MRWRLISMVAAISALAAGTSPSCAESIPVQNGSFESPATSFVSINFDSWQKTPKPDWYVEGGGFLWTQLTGIFKNTSPASPDHIVNCDGEQALWLFAVPEVGLFQDLEDSQPATNSLASRYEVGKAYQLTVGVAGWGGGMVEGVSLELSLYFRDAARNRVVVASTSVVHSMELFTNNARLVDFHVSVPVVRAEDAWAGKGIGVQLLSTVSTNLQGGYWDLDNVRLTATAGASPAGPVVASPTLSNDQFQFRLQSTPGLQFEILTATNPIQPIQEWSVAGRLTNLTGSATFTDPVTNLDGRFYRVRQLP
jgi:hypothetical protein